jgi:hypothetical protein
MLVEWLASRSGRFACRKDLPLSIDLGGAQSRLKRRISLLCREQNRDTAVQTTEWTMLENVSSVSSLSSVLSLVGIEPAKLSDSVILGHDLSEEHYSHHRQYHCFEGTHCFDFRVLSGHRRIGGTHSLHIPHI